MWPVILRELRVGSRRWTTYWLRLLAAGAVVIGILFVHVSNSAREGSEVFARMHQIVLAAIWVLVPLMTCDCLSQEKREGTLGLLFLTNLSAREIVFAKAAAHGLRAFTLWLAVIPIIGIPLLLGGLIWKEIVLSVAFAFVSICGALTTGLLASALARRMNGAVAGAALLSPVVCLLLVPIPLAFLMARLHLFQGFGWPSNAEIDLSRWMEVTSLLFWNTHHFWSDLFTRNKTGNHLLLGSLLLVPLAALLLFVFCSFLIAPIIRRNWQDKPKTKRQTETEKFFCSPVFMTSLFQRWMRRSLERNPIGWLEKRSWTGRITAWIWLAVMISFASALAYTAAGRGDFEGYNILMWGLLGTIAFVAAGSFRRERETGALELILVTPLSERRIIFGRLRGLWSQFLPTFVIWIAVVIYLSSAVKDWQVANIIRFSVAYLIVPVVGLYFSLRSRFVLLAWLAPLAACFALPQVLLWMYYYGVVITMSIVGSDGLIDVMLPPQQMVMILVQLALAAFLLRRLRVNLARRSFSLR